MKLNRCLLCLWAQSGVRAAKIHNGDKTLFIVVVSMVCFVLFLIVIDYFNVYTCILMFSSFCALSVVSAFCFYLFTFIYCRSMFKFCLFYLPEGTEAIKILLYTQQITKSCGSYFFIPLPSFTPVRYRSSLVSRIHLIVLEKKDPGTEKIQSEMLVEL